MPRDLSGADLFKALAKRGYRPTRQMGSHIRLTTTMGVDHHVTVPNHDPLRVGTLGAILDGVARHHGISRDELIRLIPG
jgi:predicted RNA binding protein YcfA (HicA-like mRNA interferase family)